MEMRIGRVLRFAVPFAEQAVVSAGTFLTTILCARQLPYELQGQFGIVLMLSIGCGTINTGVLFHIAAIDIVGRRDAGRYCGHLLALQVAMALCLTAVAVVLAGLLAQQDATVLSTRATVLVAVFLFGQQLADFQRRSEYIRGCPPRALLGTLILQPARVALLALVGVHSVEGALLLVTLPLALSVPATAWRRWNVTPWRWRRHLAFARRHLVRARWLLLSTPAVWVLSSIPVFQARLFLGLGATGLYTTARSISGTANLGLEVIETSASRVLAQHYRRDDGLYLPTLARIVAIGLALWAVGLMAIVHRGEAVLMLAGLGAYVPALPALVGLWLAKALELGTRLTSVHLRLIDGTVVQPVSSAAAVAVMAAAGPLLVPRWGLFGASLVMVAGEATILTVHLAAIAGWSGNRPARAAGRVP
jgi:O-antigen/teichoic acid export membrane protein